MEHGDSLLRAETGGAGYGFSLLFAATDGAYRPLFDAGAAAFVLSIMPSAERRRRELTRKETL